MKKQCQIHSFTLIEILSAVAVLVIMMGFIFEFTNAAQRLWATNTGRNEVSGQADVILELFNEDLENIYVVPEEEDLDTQAGWYCMHKYKDSENMPKNKAGNKLPEEMPFALVGGYSLEDFCFLTQPRKTYAEEPGVGESPSYIRVVRYHMEKDTDTGLWKLYRFEDRTNPTWSRISYDFWTEDVDGNLPARNPENFFSISTLTETKKEDYLVADNIQSLQIYSDAAFYYDEVAGEMKYTVDMPIKKLPRQIRVTISFAFSDSLKAIASKSEDTTADNRAFSRVFLLK